MVSWPLENGKGPWHTWVTMFPTTTFSTKRTRKTLGPGKLYFLQESQGLYHLFECPFPELERELEIESFGPSLTLILPEQDFLYRILEQVSTFARLLRNRLMITDYRRPWTPTIPQATVHSAVLLCVAESIYIRLLLTHTLINTLLEYTCLVFGYSDSRK